MNLEIDAAEVPAHLLEFFEPVKPWLKPLDWVDVPGMFAQAMQRDGWTWRSDVVWVKPSALPESVSGTRWERCRVRLSPGQRSAQPAKAAAYAGVFEAQSGVLNGDAPGAEWADCPGCLKCAQTDGLVLRRGSGRPTKATERVLLFTRGPGYYFDQEAVRETYSEGTHGGYALVPTGPAREDILGIRNGKGASTLGTHDSRLASGRNLRDWWVIGPEPLKDAHYAAFPSALPERCIKAGTSEWGCCPACGAPWARVVESRSVYHHTTTAKGKNGEGPYASQTGDGAGTHDIRHGVLTESTTLGWRPTCATKCSGVADAPPVPARVLDCFGGSGTTALAANRLGRDCTLVELKSEYAELARKRVGREPLSLFAWKPEDTPETTPEEVPV